MTTIAWDGKSLAVDRMGTSSTELRIRAVKARKLPSGEVVSWTGATDYGESLAAWYEAGADPGEWPDFQKAADWARLIVAESEEVHFFQRTPTSQRLYEPFMAWGTGCELAIGAMAHGASAEEAVKIACEFDIWSGMGVDVFVLEPASVDGVESTKKQPISTP